MGISLKRLESNALRELSLILRKDAKDKFFSSISITEVRITNDLSFMTVFYTSYDDNEEHIQKILEQSKGYLRAELAKKLQARKMPELIFKRDSSLDYGNHINDLLASIKKDNN
ncbi:MAG: 30S ribosome-binding factor RbfA [Anaeroplasma sp.]